MPEDKAWAEFKTPLDSTELLKFCENIERLFRINPYLEIKAWEKLSAHQYKIHAVNHSQQPEFTIETNIQVQLGTSEIKFIYSKGLKTCTSIIIEEDALGSKLTITETYNPITNKNDRLNLAEVDKSLNKWAEEIQIYLIQWEKWSWCMPWRLYKENIWLPMKPMARRITYIIILISLFEIALIILGIAIYIIEFR